MIQEKIFVKIKIAAEPLKKGIKNFQNSFFLYSFASERNITNI